MTSPPSSRIVVAHGVHADAAAGDVARDLGGREAGVEEQLDGAVGMSIDVDGVGGDQPALGGLARPTLAGSMPRPSSRT